MDDLKMYLDKCGEYNYALYYAINNNTRDIREAIGHPWIPGIKYL